MPPIRPLARALALVVLPAIVAPGGAAHAAPAQSAVSKTLRAQPGACVARSYRAPAAGFLDVRLRGRGDWDLQLRAGRVALATSEGFRGREVAQAWVRAGQRIAARGCRRRGAGSRARVTFRLAPLALPAAAAAPPALVRVRGSAERIRSLEASGLDVTESRGPGWADVVVRDAAQHALVAASGLARSVRVADLAGAFALARAADRRYSARAGATGSPLPSGRTGYRTYEDVQSELKSLARHHDGLVRKVVFGRSFQGREISGLEIARDVGADDGRPVLFVMALHHAREWPSLEAAMELARLLVAQRDDARVARLLARVRVVVLPLVNPDGFIASRSAVDPGDRLLGQQVDVTTAQALAPPGGQFAYRRKNCDGELFGPAYPCELAWGVDPNRNYGALWGGAGSSSDPTDQTYHGRGPRSEPEVRAVWDYVRSHHVTTLVSLHTFGALVLRPPGTSVAGEMPDEERMRRVGDAVAEAAGYDSRLGFQLYDTTGTTEDDTYSATGGYGYTIEMGPADGDFHMDYSTGVVDEWTGASAAARGGGGLGEALLVAAEAAADPADHAVLRGTAPAGRVLRLRKRFETLTSPFCAGSPVAACPGGRRAPLSLADELDARTRVPADGVLDWHIGPSTRPFAERREAYELTCEEPAGTVRERLSLVVDRGQAVWLQVGCGAAPTRWENRRRVGGDPDAPPPATAPAVNGVPVPVLTAAQRRDAERRRRLAACRARAGSAARRGAARRACARRHGAAARRRTAAGRARTGR